ncbi:HNH endonuclease [Clavibacter phage CN1A]|uniref:HNH endonuclease n=1 Tax=Clavibacter phage CN1A TaxID=1406793 RepID=U5PTU3_9CAUD|nr:HNH endonuclease [Clavibacter phage CN1A]AGY47176.1 HNH endonuclease [Clavibacter phage CN1A]
MVERFWSKVYKTHGCWLWEAAVGKDGYGRFREGGRGSRLLAAHRVAYELEVGPIPDGLQLDHLCRTRSCVRPDHLEAVTSAENTRRGKAGESAGAANRAKVRCPQDHEYTSENTYVYRGSRYCRACHKRREAVRRKGREVVA